MKLKKEDRMEEKVPAGCVRLLLERILTIYTGRTETLDEND